MIIHEPKFKIGDHVKTNNMYRDYFSSEIEGTVSKVEPCNILESEIKADGCRCYTDRVAEIVILVTVNENPSLNQDYFELVK